ncbi:hypothetical protein AB0B66_08200 [Catellatospora sp. NPDC049111]|uniref:hypothetical protein n=1 Tax=Catellatospora sp. NPDC049111 TaxID=3155271 RepID=UPI00340B6C65
MTTTSPNRVAAPADPAAIGADACVAQLRETGLLPADTLAVLLVGSAALGWANEGSDYNLYVVSAGPWTPGEGPGKYAPLTPPVIPTRAVSSGDRTWQLKYWSQGQIDQVLDKVARAVADGPPSGTPLAEIEELFLERLLTGVSVLGGDWLARHRDRVSRGGFQAATVARSLADAAADAGRTRRRLAAGQTEAAVLAARLAFDATVDALLESHGDYGVYVPKWRARRMRQVAPAELPFDTYWTWETMSGLDRDRPEAWVVDALALCDRIAAAIAARIPTSPAVAPRHAPVPAGAAVLHAGPAVRGWTEGDEDSYQYVIGADPGDAAEPTGPHPVATGVAAPGRWHWSASAVDRLLARVGAEQFASGAARKPLRKHEELLLEHLITGTAVAGGDWLDQRRATARDSAFGSFATSRSLGDGLAAWEDATGQLAASDVHSAVLSARKTFDHAVDALLERDGVYGAHLPHWREQRFRAAAPAELTAERYWAVETMAGLDPADPGPWVRQVTELSRDLLAAHPDAVTRMATRGPRRGW